MLEAKDIISIIVPVYNREAVLDNCIESILNQSYKNIQLILIDDGSTDHSLFVCQNYAKKDSRVFVLHKSNGGPGSARNLGLDVAIGKYIMFVDSDDCIHSKCIELMYNAIRKFNVGIAMCEYADNNLQSNRSKRAHTVLLDTKTVLKNGFNEKGNILYGCGKLWNIDIIKDLRFRPLSHCEDTLFNIESLLEYNGYIAYITNHPLYYYLKQDDSITRNLSNKNLLDLLDVIEIVLKRTELLSDDIKISSKTYGVSAAFFAYLKAGDERDSKLVRNCAFKFIHKYRKTALCNLSSPLKVKIACLISYVSMDAVKILYKLIKE